MSYRTWLKDANHIGDLSSYFVWPKLGDTEEAWHKQDDLELRRLNRENSIFKASVPLEPEHAQFFGGKMRDSYLQEVSRQGDQYVVVISDWRAHWFAGTLSGMLEIVRPKEPWLITLILTDVQYVRWAQPDKKGYLKFIRPEIHICEDDSWISEYIRMDWFVEQDGRLQWIMVSNMDQVLMVDCGGAYAIDERTACIRKAFGEAGEKLWTHCWAKFTNSHDWHTLMYTPPYLLSQMGELGLTREDFLAQSG